MISKIKSLLLFVICIGAPLWASKPNTGSSGSTGTSSGGTSGHAYTGRLTFSTNSGNDGGGSKQTGTHANFSIPQPGYRAPEGTSTSQTPSLTPSQVKDIADGYAIGWRGPNTTPVHYIDNHGTTPHDPNLRATESEATRNAGTGNRSAARSGSTHPSSSGSGSVGSAGSINPQNSLLYGSNHSEPTPSYTNGSGYYYEMVEPDPDMESTSHYVDEPDGYPAYRKVYYEDPQEEPAQTKASVSTQNKSETGKAKSESISATASTATAAATVSKSTTRNHDDSSDNSNNHVVDPDKEEYEATVYRCQEREPRQVHSYVIYLAGLSDIELAQEAQALQAKLAHTRQHYVRLSGNIAVPRGLERQRFAKTRLDAAEKLYGFARAEAYKREAALRMHESECAILEASLVACQRQQVESKKRFDELYAREKAEQEKFLKNSSIALWLLEADKKIAAYEKNIADCGIEINNIKKQLVEVGSKIDAFDGHHPVKKGWAFIKGLIWTSEHYTSLSKDFNELKEKLGARQAEIVALKNNILVLQRLKSERADLPKECTGSSSVARQGQNKEQGESSAHTQLTANQRQLLLQSNLDVTIFEQSRSSDAQNHIFKKINDALAIAAEAHAKGAKDQKIDPYNQAIAILCVMSHTHHQQGRISDTQKACGLAQAIAQTVATNNRAPNSDIDDIARDIEGYITDAIQQVKDSDFLISLKDRWIAFKNNQSANTRKELSLLFGAMGAGTVSAGSGSNWGTATLSLAFESILTDQVASMGAVSAAAAVDPRPPLFRAIDEVLKPIEQMSANGKNQNTSNKDKNTGSGGVSKSQKYPHGTYKDAGYHHANSKDGKNPPPQNGQKALDNSILIKNTSPNRVAVEGDNFVMLRETRGGPIPEFHGNLQTWQELSQDAQTALREAGICNHKGKILGQIG